MASGLLVAVIGGVLLRSAVLARGRERAREGDVHRHAQGHGHSHGNGHGHGHEHRRAGLVGMGVAYGLGMAAMLTAAGLVLVSLRDRFGPRLARFRGFADFTPLRTAALVMLVGVGLATRALAG